jgi:hypothetical protein
MRIWSVPHLKASCWYIDYGKMYYPIEEEDVRKACEKANSKGATMDTDNIEEQEEEVEVDINLLPEKEKNKNFNQRIRDAKKAEEKAKKEAQKAKDKAKNDTKKAKKSWKSKASTPPLFLTETSIALRLQSPYKQCRVVNNYTM